MERVGAYFFVALLCLSFTTKAESVDAEAARQLQSLNRAFTSIAREVTPTVVTITTKKRSDRGRRRIPPSPYHFFFDQNERGQEAPQMEGLGSGIVMTSDGYILTNNHVAGGADEIIVELNDNQEFPAKLVGTDSLTDVAVIKIDAKNLQAARIGNSDKIQIGEWVLAVGAPMGFNNTVTSGIISAVGRDLNLIGDNFGIENFIQTDAAINMGNSGGSLVNLSGEVIGINTAIATPTRTFVGYGFAIPINLAKKVMDDIIEFGRVRRGYLGISLAPVDAAAAEAMGMEKPRGVLVNDIIPDTPAESAGLKPMDIILGINDQDVNRPNQIQSIIARRHPGDKVRLSVLRDRNNLTLDVTLGEADASILAERSRPRKPGAAEGIGLNVQNLTPEVRESHGIEEDVTGVIVTGVSRSLGRTEFRPGDIIFQIRQRDFEMKIESVGDFEIAIGKLQKGTNAAFLVYREGSRLFRTMKIPQ